MVLVRKRGTAMLVRWPMARGAPASRLSHVSPDVYAGEPCGRTFLHVYAYTYRVRANSRACARAWFTYTHTHICTHPRARECFARTTLWGDCIATLLWLALAPSAWTFSVLSCVKKKKKERNEEKGIYLHLLLFPRIKMTWQLRERRSEL